MHVIDIFLPLYDNERRPLAKALFQEVVTELTEKFGGLTAHTRAPAQGLWQPEDGEAPTRDDIVIYQVLVDSIDREWWSGYRARLETRFRQEQVLIRALPVEVL